MPYLHTAGEATVGIVNVNAFNDPEVVTTMHSCRQIIASVSVNLAGVRVAR
jgi:hypothetical protein